MIIPDKKKAVMAILSKRAPEGGEKTAEVKPEERVGGDPAIRSVAEDIISAIEGKSVNDLEQALMSFKEMIRAEDEEQDQDEEMMHEE